MANKKKTPKKNGLEFYTGDFPSRSYRTNRGRKLSIYRKEYRWRIYKQGRIIAASTEGYARLQGAENNLRSVSKVLRGGLHNEPVSDAIANFKSKKK